MKISPKFENYKLDKNLNNIKAVSVKTSAEYQPNYNLKFLGGNKIYSANSMKSFLKILLALNLKYN